MFKPNKHSGFFSPQQQFQAPPSPGPAIRPAQGPANIRRSEWEFATAPFIDPYSQQGPSFQSPNIQSPPTISRTGVGQVNFGNQVIFQLELDSQQLLNLNIDQTKYGDKKTKELELYYDIKREVYQPVYNKMVEYIAQPDVAVVPKDTGRLRGAMLASISGTNNYTRIGDLHPFIVVLNTGNVRYAPFVNLMPTPWLQHPHPWHVNTTWRKWKPKQKQPRALYDPNAQTNWFEKVTNAGQTEFFKVWDIYQNTTLANRFQKTNANFGGINVGLSLFKVTI